MMTPQDTVRPHVRLLIFIPALALMASLPASAASLAADAPPGFTTHALAPSASGASALEISRSADDAGCDVVFRPVPANAASTQAQLNAVAAKPEFLQALRQRAGAKFDNADIGPFTAGDVQGGAVVGIPLESDSAVRAMLVIFDTPEGHTEVSCSADAAQFDALLPGFEAVARSVKPPKG